MDDRLSILEAAISNVGYWRWWSQRLPESFQVEFGGVQLWTPLSDEGSPQPGLFALRFHAPSVVAFLTDASAADVPGDWPERLHDDKIEPFSITYEAFFLGSKGDTSDLIENCAIDMRVGTEADLTATPAGVRLAFRAGPVGLIVHAERFTLVSVEGTLEPDQIEDAWRKWWDYWREYWQRRDGESPMPEDYVCEVTIPAEPDED